MATPKTLQSTVLTASNGMQFEVRTIHYQPGTGFEGYQVSTYRTHKGQTQKVAEVDLKRNLAGAPAEHEAQVAKIKAQAAKAGITLV